MHLYSFSDSFEALKVNRKTIFIDYRKRMLKLNELFGNWI